jgi:transposase-like protein
MSAASTGNNTHGRAGGDAAIFIDAIVVKIRDGQVANRPIYAAIGVSLDGRRDVLGLWAGTGGEGAKFSDERAH